jgi:hypothetical protein
MRAAIANSDFLAEESYASEFFLSGDSHRDGHQNFARAFFIGSHRLGFHLSRFALHPRFPVYC